MTKISQNLIIFLYFLRLRVLRNNMFFPIVHDSIIISFYEMQVFTINDVNNSGAIVLT